MQTTNNLDYVFFNLLIYSSSLLETTYPIFLVLLPLLVLIIGAYWSKKRNKKLAEIEAHRVEVSRLRNLLHKVKDYSFRRIPFICATTYEVKYYKEVLKYYSNVGRVVELVEHTEGQDFYLYSEIKTSTFRHHCAVQKDMIREGEENACRYWDGLERNGLLDYLKTPKGPNWEKSKKYIEEITAYLVEHDRPRPRDQAKKKLVMDVMPSHRIG